MRRTNLVLSLALVVLVLGVWFFERQRLSTADVSDRADRLVPELVVERLTAFEVERAGATTRYVRSGSADEPRYRMSGSVEADGSATRIDEALSTLKWAAPVRVLGASTPADARRFGLDRPHLRLRFEVAGVTHRVAFGGTDPLGQRYAEVDGRHYVVEPAVADAFDHDTNTFRDARLAPGAAVPSRLAVRTSAGEVVVARGGGGFRMTAPYDATASVGRVHAVVDALRTMQAQRFVAERPDAATLDAHFGSPRMTLALDGLRVIFGDPCAPVGVHARAGDGPLVCVSEQDVAALEQPVGAYLDTRVSPTEPGGVREITLEEAGKTLRLVESDGSFRFELGSDVGPADVDVVEEWLDRLRALRATEVLPMTDDFTPTLVVTTRRGALGDDVLRLQRRSDSLLARRGEDRVLMRFPASLGERLLVSSGLVRSRRLLEERVGSLTSLTIARGAVSERVDVDADGTAHVRTPVATLADPGRVADLTARLAGLEAVRFVSDEPMPSQGFSSPRAEVTVTFVGDAGPQQRRLVVGAPAGEDGAYAQLEGVRAVFVLRQETVDLLLAPLANRDPVATDLTRVRSAEVRAGGVTVRVSRDGEHYVADRADIAEEDARAAYYALGELRATAALEYGTSDASLGLERPRAEILLHRDATAGAPETLTLRVGRRATTSDDDLAYVEAGGVVLRIPEAQLAPLWRLVQPPP